MIVINKGMENAVALTLNESITLDQQLFLFRLTNDTTGGTKTFAAADQSPATLRYNLFNITESSAEDLHDGTVSLSPAGHWTYEVFEMEVTSPPSLDCDDAVALLETGKAYVASAYEPDLPSFGEPETELPSFGD